MRGAVIAIVIGLGGCGAAQGTRAPAASQRGPATRAQAIMPSEGSQNAPEAITAAADPGGGAARAPGTSQIISVRPGFRPDPVIRTGVAGGPQSAELLDARCRGYIADAPSYVLKVDADTPGLRVLVSMRGDATLVMQLADGRWLCNDDTEGLNPVLTGPFPPGRHRIWVGTYSPTPEGGIPYTIAFTASPSVSTESIEGARPTP